jgi:uncharacterized protein YecE (DUF72 family)
MANLYAGTSGWAYATWKPGFYPAKLPSKKFLEHYATQLNSVEVNYTFRRRVSDVTLDSWIQSTPENFRFSAKAHQRITHILRLKDAGESVRFFLESLEPLAQAGKLGVVLIQLPPFLKANVELLSEFLAELPRAHRVAFEFRHESWFADSIYEVLKGRNAALCIAESEKLECPDVATANFVYYRFRKPEYSKADTRAIENRIREHLSAGRDAFVYFKHEETPEGALNAVQLLAQFNPPAQTK